MKEQFATYKIALAVKELGFDESCFAYYEISDLIKKGYRLRYVEHEDNNPTKQSKNNSYILAPLWQQVIEFLKKFGVFVQEYINEFEECVYIIRYPHNKTCIFSDEEFGNKELAILTAIEIINQRIND
jgi:hypothetical protein